MIDARNSPPSQSAVRKHKLRTFGKCAKLRRMLNLEENLLERFLRYVRIFSESDSVLAHGGRQPSTPQQFDMAAALSTELKDMGMQDVQTTEFCYTYAVLPASAGFEGAPSFCLLAHMDTVDEVSGKDVSPRVFRGYDGGPINLPGGKDSGPVVLDPAQDEALAQAGTEHDTVITSDGSTLLGADDKAGIAAVMTALEYLLKNKDAPHGMIEVLFSPDEETGHGMDHVPLNLIKSRMAYTVDGGHRGELECECFNAFRADVVFKGKSMHTGSARPGMVNALLMAASFVGSLPRHQMPETTDGYMGFYAPMSMTGGIESASVSLILRDFSWQGMEERKNLVTLLSDATARAFGGTAEVKFEEQYRNMRDGLDKSPLVKENLIRAYRAAGIEPVIVPIRGGTDGSRLTEMGIPTPNIFTGAHNFHSRYEWASLSQMAQAAEVLVMLAGIWAGAA